VQNRNRPTAQCGPVFVLLPPRRHTSLDWPDPPGFFPLHTRLASSRQHAEAPTAGVACRPRQLPLRRAPLASRPPRAAHAVAAPGAVPLADPRLLSAEAKPHLSSPLHSNRRRVLTQSALPSLSTSTPSTGHCAPPSCTSTPLPSARTVVAPSRPPSLLSRPPSCRPPSLVFLQPRQPHQ
jgi:hypothetical protein